MNADKPKVVSIAGAAIPLPGVPVEQVVDVCRKALALAENGELKGVVVVRLHRDDCTTSDRGGFTNRSLVGLLEQIKIEIVQEHIKADR